MDTSSELPIPSSAANLPLSLEFLGRPPLIRGEESSGYDALLARVAGAVTPADIVEEFWVRDVVDLVWETVRLRREKAGLMNASAHEGLSQVLQRFDGIDRYELTKRWAEGDSGAALEVGVLLASAGLTMDAVMGLTLRLRIAEIERIDRMTMAAEARRNLALRELERYRASFAANLRRAAQNAENAARNVEDAEFEDVVPAVAQEPAQGSADAAA